MNSYILETKTNNMKTEYLRLKANTILKAINKAYKIESINEVTAIYKMGEKKHD